MSERDPAESLDSKLQPVPAEHASMPRANIRPLRAFYFFRDRAQDQHPFTVADLNDATGWKGDSAPTYMGKFWSQFLDRKRGSDSYIVNYRFLRVKINEFMANFTQKRLLLGTYSRSFHPYVVTYEFLLPLARENALRVSLDSLFYVDTVQRRISELGVGQIAKVIERLDDELDESYISRVVDLIGDYFGGYSISHVQGRFRASDGLLSRGEAGRKVAEESRYLIDETTASVRFIVPLSAAQTEFGENFGDMVDPASSTDVAVPPANVAEELAIVRALFSGFFVEAVVDTVRGEDEIWLIERSPFGEKLFRWSASVRDRSAE